MASNSQFQSTYTPSQRSLRAFLCHASDDKPRVRALYKQLLAEGIDPWFDKENLLPGQNWQQEIQNTLRIIDVVIVCLSENSINKVGFVQKEIAFALDRADEHPLGMIFVIPVKLENCVVPQRLSHLHTIDLYEEQGFEFLMRSLKNRADTLGVTLKPISTNQSVFLQSENVENDSQRGKPATEAKDIDITFINVSDNAEMDAELSTTMTAKDVIRALISENFIPPLSNSKWPYLLFIEGNSVLNDEQTLADAGVRPYDRILVYGAMAKKRSKPATKAKDIDITFINVSDNAEMDAELSTTMTAKDVIRALISENFILPLEDSTSSYLLSIKGRKIIQEKETLGHAGAQPKDRILVNIVRRGS